MPRDAPQIQIASANSPLAKANDGISIAGQAAQSSPHSSQPNTKDKQPKQQDARNKDSHSRSPKVSNMSLSGQSIKGQTPRYSRESRADNSSSTQSSTNIKGQAKGSTELSAGQIQIKEQASKRAMQNEGDRKQAHHKRPKKDGRYGSAVGIVGSGTSQVPETKAQPAAAAAAEIAISGTALKKQGDSPPGKRELVKPKRRSLFGYQMSRVLREEQAKDAKSREQRGLGPVAAASTNTSTSNAVTTSTQSEPMHSSQLKPKAISAPTEVQGASSTKKQQPHAATRDIAVSTNEPPPVKAQTKQESTEQCNEQSDIELHATFDF